VRQVRYHRYGKPGVLQIDEVSLPEVKVDRVRVRVHYVGLNPKDAALRNGFLGKFRNRKFPKLTGFDFAGVIEVIGEEVTTFEIGDHVFGYLENLNGGAAADYVVVNQYHLSKTSIDLKEAAVIPCVYLTAWQAFQQVHLKPIQHVLIYGGSGGTGTAAIQIAKQLGAKVTTVSSSRNISYCTSRGADYAIGYEDTDVFQSEIRYDVFFQAHVISGDLYKQAKSILKPGGKFVTLAPNPFRRLLNPFRANKIYPIVVRARRVDLEKIDALFVENQLQVVIQEDYALEEIQSAHQSIQSQHTVGKIVVKVV
jgi:NADPH:quinone reductase-like Zn-dependent oxidoreductase